MHFHVFSMHSCCAFFFFNATDRTPHFVNRHANEDSTRLACHAVAREFRGGGGIRSHRSDAEALRRFAQRIFLFSDRSGDGSYMARKCAAKDDGETHTPVLTHAVHACEHGAEVPCGSDTDRFQQPPLAALPAYRCGSSTRVGAGGSVFIHHEIHPKAAGTCPCRKKTCRYCCIYARVPVRGQNRNFDIVQFCANFVPEKTMYSPVQFAVSSDAQSS